MSPPKAKIARSTRAKASEVAGPWFTSRLICLRCSRTSSATYAIPPEVFPCWYCGRRAAVRDEPGVPADYHDRPQRLH